MTIDKNIQSILQYISPVITHYKTGDEILHSGTGLLLCDANKHTYLLTAYHVIDPELRYPEVSKNPKHHLYASRSQPHELPVNTIPLMQKHFGSKDHDLVILRSSKNNLSTGESVILSVNKILNVSEPTENDSYLIVGFPAAGNSVTPDKVFHYTGQEITFSMSDGRRDPDFEDTRIRVKYRGKNSAKPEPKSPEGLSGSPLWRIDKERKIHFFGIVSRYFTDSEEIQVVRPEVCREFIRQALDEIPRINEIDPYLESIDLPSDEYFRSVFNETEIK